MAGSLTAATKENFRDLVAEGTVMVDVWGTDCRPCLALMPHVEKLAEARDDVTVVALEAPKARRLCMELKVLGLPAFLLFHNGQEVSRLDGPDLRAAAIDEWLDKTIASLDDKE
ncbi:MAG TPA: thioredoxin family protein [Acidimicrobiales bacterium]|nr:thioredoxin family protein [Acidimicrobiales bacterium]